MTAGDAVLQVPLTYRDERLDGAKDFDLTEMAHWAHAGRTTAWATQRS